MVGDLRILGIHHVTALTADAQKNIDFYTGILGLRLVKLTVNFDDPSSYHLYYGDDAGSPGTILTFFAWPGAFEGRKGPPQVTVTAFAAPPAAVKYWPAWLTDHGMKVDPLIDRFGAQVLGFSDPDGLRLEIIFAGDVRPDRLTRFHSVTIAEEGYEHTARLLTDTMGFRKTGEEQNRFRFEVADGGPGASVDLLCVPGAQGGTMGAGAVHHIAWRTADDGQQLAWREQLTKIGRNVSPVMDRTYFHSIYYREPGGVLFEIATDVPGFAVDEPASHLGEKLMLPKWYEQYRPQITRGLPMVKLPKGGQIGGKS